MEATEHNGSPAGRLAAARTALAQGAQRLCSLTASVWRDPSGQAPWICLFWSFWFSLATFPMGYGLREVTPLVCLVFLLLYYRRAWRQSVLCRLPVRPLFYCLGGMILIGVFFSEDVWTSLLHAGTGINKGFILPFIAMECVRDEKDLRRLVWACVLACFWQGLDGLWQARRSPPQARPLRPDPAAGRAGPARPGSGGRRGGRWPLESLGTGLARLYAAPLAGQRRGHL